MNQRLNEQMISSLVVAVLCAICLMAAVALPTAASSPSEKEQPEQRAPAAPTAELVTTKAMRVIYDPESGEFLSVPILGTGVLSDPLAKALTRSTEGLQVFELSNGGRGVHLDGRFQHALMVRLKPDGSIETVCTSHSHAAEKFLQANPTGVDAEPRDK